MPTKTVKTSTSSYRMAPSNEDGPAPKRAKRATSPRGGQGKHPTAESPPACPSWADLRPELLSHVARFVSPDTADMMNFLFCVGPKVAVIVRSTYLSGNDDYLRECLLKTPPYSTGGSSKTRSRILTWMVHNDWKERCVLSERHVFNVSFEKKLLSEFLCEDLAGAGLVCICPSIKVSQEMMFHLQLFDNSSLWEAYHDFHRAAEGIPVILGIGDKKIAYGTSADQVRSVLNKATPDSDGKIELKIGRLIDIVFSYPRVFIGLGLDSVLKYHLDEGILRPNSTVEGSRLIEGKDDMPLLWQAMQEPRGFCFRYLLGLSDVHVTGRNDDAATNGLHLMHVAAGYLEAEWVRAHLESLLDHPLVDPNAVSDNGLTALHCICFSMSLPHEEKLARIRLFLEKGAEPSIEGDDGQTVTDDIRDMMRSDEFTALGRIQLKELIDSLNPNKGG